MNGHIFFTADTHFGTDAKRIICRDNRPFRSPGEYFTRQTKLWNKQAGEGDTIYVVGDMLNYNNDEHGWEIVLKLPDIIKAKIFLVIGNNEQRLIDAEFDGNFSAFRNKLLLYGFLDVQESTDVEVNGIMYHVVHQPVNCRNDMRNLFGHVHKTTGLYKPCGLNVGTDLNYFRLYTENDIKRLEEERRIYWDVDPDIQTGVYKDNES